MSNVTSLTTEDAESLREQVTGTVVLPGDEGWDDARQAWNLSVDQRPSAVVLRSRPKTSWQLSDSPPDMVCAWHRRGRDTAPSRWARLQTRSC